MSDTIIVHPGELTEHPANSNTHDRRNLEELAESRRLFGQYKNIVVWEPPEEMTVEVNGNEYTLKPGIKYVIAGNGFHQASLLRGDDSIEVKDYSHLSYDEAVLLMETDNASPLGGRIDPDKMRLNLERVRGLTADNERMTSMLERARELHGVNGKGPKVKDIESQVNKAAELQEKWETETGQLWLLDSGNGYNHKLICGDCTDKDVVNAVAFGEIFDLVCTDPPYGVSYADKNKYLNAVAKGNRIQVPIENDHLTVEQATELWRKAFSLLYEFTKPGGAYYINAPQGGDLMMMMMMLSEARWLLKPQIIWVKNNHVLGRSDYQLKHEPILYGWKPGASHYFTNSRSEYSVWEIDKPLNSDFHPTTKPVELIEKAIKNSSKPGEIVADFFIGSGTTIIAAENTGRCARGIEISPGYTAVSIQRWVDATGGEPRLVEKFD